MSATENTAGPHNVSRLAGKKAIRAYARKLAEPETIKDLNITPMMDMMTIILVFLLKQFASSGALITQDSNMQLAASNTPHKAKVAIQVTVTKKVVMIEGEAVVPVSNGRIEAQYKPDGENGYKVQQIVDTLTKISNREKRVAELQGQTFASELMVVADKGTPYRLLTEVLYSCGQAGYANYRLIVLKTRD
jgi:biopolymer transport protein ExbD